ncbi:MAG: DUF6359 domain-containing protein [Candidatus Aphodosoma sp.]
MKQIKFLLLVAVALIATACPPVPINPPNPGGEEQTEKGEGTFEKPYSVEEAITKTGEAYVKGYIVGFMEVTLGSPVFSAETDSVNTNILIADSTQNIVTYMPVQLPSGEIRNALNLLDNKELLNKEVIIYGQITSYFSMPGIRGTSYAWIDGQEYGNKPISNEDIIFTHTFSTDMGAFTTYNVSGDQTWYVDTKYGYAMITGYVNSQNLANEDWLITPEISLEGINEAKMNFDHVLRYFSKPSQEASILVSENYTDGDPNEATWVELPNEFSNAGDWTINRSNDFDLTPYLGKHIKIAFRYVSTASKAGTWEIKAVNVIKAKAIDPYAGLIFHESFTKSLGDFTTQNDVLPSGLTSVWTYDANYQCAKGTGFSSTKQDALGYLISPEIDLSKVTTATMTFENAGNYMVDASQELTVWITTSSEKTAVDEEWIQLPVDKYSAGSFAFTTATISLDDYCGSKVKIAFKYYSTPDMCATWELRNMEIK